MLKERPTKGLDERYEYLNPKTVTEELDNIY